MERNDRAIVATFYFDGPLAPGETIELAEAAAHHVRVRRLVTGDALLLTDGAGTRARAELGVVRRAAVEARITETERVERPPAVHLSAPIADRDRMLWLAEKATELGVATWQSVRFRRSTSVSPRGEGDGFRARLRARMIGALEQSGGAWLPEIMPEVEPPDLPLPGDAMGLVLDRCGAPIIPALAGWSGAVTIALGPEGGLEPDELELLRARGWRSVRLATTTLRFETAAIAAVAIARAATMTEDA